MGAIGAANAKREERKGRKERKSESKSIHKTNTFTVKENNVHATPARGCFPYHWSRTIQTDNHTIHIEKPAVKTNIQTMTTSLLSINLRALANKTDSNPMLTNTANTMDPLIKGAVVRSLAA